MPAEDDSCPLRTPRARWTSTESRWTTTDPRGGQHKTTNRGGAVFWSWILAKLLLDSPKHSMKPPISEVACNKKWILHLATLQVGSPCQRLYRLDLRANDNPTRISLHSTPRHGSSDQRVRGADPPPAVPDTPPHCPPYRRLIRKHHR